MEPSLAMDVTLEGGGALRGSFRAPGDKSLSHRALILSALADGPAVLEGLADGDDVRHTSDVLKRLGIDVTPVERGVRVDGAGLHGLRSPASPLDCGNSGTTMRLCAGLLAGAGLAATLEGDASLQRRPMKRLCAPLREMGAHIEAVQSRGEELAPLRLTPRPLKGGRFSLSVPSAQVKSAVLLAGLLAQEPVEVEEPLPSRDHTERMLGAMGCALRATERRAVLKPEASLQPLGQLAIAGDPSSAAYFLGAAAAFPGSEVVAREVLLNPRRTGFLRALSAMGAIVETELREIRAGEPVGDIAVRGAGLRGIAIAPEQVVDLIDELPLLAALAALATGETVVHGASELRAKETDRIRSMAVGLRQLGAEVEELPDGWRIAGARPLRAARVDSAGDHRTAMALAVACLAAQGCSTLTGAEWVPTSYPGFFTALQGLREGQTT